MKSRQMTQMSHRPTLGLQLCGCASLASARDGALAGVVLEAPLAAGLPLAAPGSTSSGPLTTGCSQRTSLHGNLHQCKTNVDLWGIGSFIDHIFTSLARSERSEGAITLLQSPQKQMPRAAAHITNQDRARRQFDEVHASPGPVGQCRKTAPAAVHALKRSLSSRRLHGLAMLVRDGCLQGVRPLESLEVRVHIVLLAGWHPAFTSHPVLHVAQRP